MIENQIIGNTTALFLLLTGFVLGIHVGMIWLYVFGSLGFKCLNKLWDWIDKKAGFKERDRVLQPLTKRIREDIKEIRNAGKEGNGGG